MAGYNVQFDDIPAYTDSSYADGQALMGGSNTGPSPDAISVARAAAIMILVGLVALWALGYWFKKG